MAGFSSRVKNMKFMKKAENNSEEVEVQGKKLKDESEWQLPHSKEYLQKIRHKQPKVKVVGYTTLLGGTGRHNFGFVKTKKNEESKDDDKPKGDEKTDQPEVKDEVTSKQASKEIDDDKKSVRASNRSLLDLWSDKKSGKKSKKRDRSPEKEKNRKQRKT